MALVRPPRTDGHRQRDALLQHFYDAGLQPIVSTNGSIPNADIQIVKALLPAKDGTGGDGQYGEVIEAYLTDRGAQRLANPTAVFEDVVLSPRMQKGLNRARG